jgi:hypothetical protein
VHWRRTTAIALGAVTIGAVWAGAPASATTAPPAVYATAHAGLYTTQPADTPDRLLSLGATVTFAAHAGDQHVILSGLQVSRASTLTAVTQVLACRTAGSPHLLANIVQLVERGHNVLPGTAISSQLARFVFTAPSDASYDCSLDAILINHTDVAHSGVITVTSGYVRDAGKVQWAVQSRSQVRERVTRTASVVMLSRAPLPTGLTRINVVGDVAITVCSTVYWLCPAEGAHSAYIRTQLVVEQLNANGSVCSLARDTTVIRTVTYAVHHEELYHGLGNILVDSSCTGHMVTAYVVVTVVRPYSLKSDDFEVESSNESLSYID